MQKVSWAKLILRRKAGPPALSAIMHTAIPCQKYPRFVKAATRIPTGFDQIDPMDVTESTVKALSGIRIKLAQAKTIGKEPPFIPEFPEDLGAFQIGFVAFGSGACPVLHRLSRVHCAGTEEII